MVNVQYYCFLTNIITKTKMCESETTFFNFVNLPKREKIPLRTAHPTSWLPKCLKQHKFVCIVISVILWRNIKINKLFHLSSWIFNLTSSLMMMFYFRLNVFVSKCIVIDLFIYIN